MALTLASIALYGAGVTSTLSPCVLPLVPGYLGVLADSAGAGNHARPQRVAIFAAGAIATFVALGGVVAAIGLTLTGTIERLQRLAGLGLILMASMMLVGKLGKLATERTPRPRAPGTTAPSRSPARDRLWRGLEPLCWTPARCRAHRSRGFRLGVARLMASVRVRLRCADAIPRRGVPTEPERGAACAHPRPQADGCVADRDTESRRIVDRRLVRRLRAGAQDWRVVAYAPPKDAVTTCQRPSAPTNHEQVMAEHHRARRRFTWRVSGDDEELGYRTGRQPIVGHGVEGVHRDRGPLIPRPWAPPRAENRARRSKDLRRVANHV